ncbi:MAG: hypothetical protein SPL52_16550 [Fibrobacter sp.]|nr:hypothetical protein [Fibrobacter sp.]
MIVTLRNVDTPFLSVIESLLQLRKDVYMETSEEESNDSCRTPFSLTT